jgi:hypothetical protein
MAHKNYDPGRKSEEVEFKVLIAKQKKYYPVILIENMKIKLIVIIVVNLLLAMSSMAQVPNYVPTSSLIAWYSFNGNANDLSGNGNNGALLNGVASTTNRFGTVNSAYSFDGVDDGIYVNNSFFDNGWNQYTVSMWVYLNAMANPNNPNSSHIFFNTDPYYGIGFGTNWGGSNKYYFYMGNGTPALSWNAVNNDQSNQIVTIGAWKLVTFLKSANNYSLYIDNALDQTWISPTTIQSYIYKMYFGRTNPSNANEVINGKLDDIGIWNRALSPCEISQLFTASTSTGIINAATSSSMLCSGQTATLTASGGSSYTWNPGGVAGPTIAVSPTTTTNYSVLGTYSLTCTGNATVSQNVTDCTGISSYSAIQNSRLMIYPNPNNGEFTISAEVNIILTLNNELGQIIKTIYLNEKNNRKSSVMNIANGIYFISGNNGTNSIKERIIVSK